MIETTSLIVLQWVLPTVAIAAVLKWISGMIGGSPSE
jgi:hypothetical protein